MSAQGAAGNTRPLVITDLGTVATGDIRRPVAEGDTIVIRDGRIAEIGARSSVDTPDHAIIVEAQGQDAMPGMLDSHIHPVVGDWTPRMSTVGWLDSYAQAGITTSLSQGTWHQGGYPSDARGMVSLAITLGRGFHDFRPGRMKVHGGTVSLVEGLTREDFELLAAEGIWLVAEVGSRSIVDPPVVRDMLTLAHELGFVSRVHFGPESVPGTFTVTAEMASVMGAHIASHVNGGPSTPPADDLDFMVNEQDCYLELSYLGNHKALLRVAQGTLERGEPWRLIAGSDTPTGGGIQPRAILQTIGLLSTFLGMPPTEAVAVGTGNTADAYGLLTGKLEVGREADVLLVDAPKGSGASSALESLEIGDTPSVALLVIDGEIVSVGTRNTLPSKRRPKVIDDHSG